MSTSADEVLGLAQFVVSAKIGRCQPWLDYYGPYSGNRTIYEYSETPGPIYTPRHVRFSQGVTVQLYGAIPAGWSYTTGWVSEDGQYELSVYEPPLGQLVVQHQFPNGAWATTQVESIVAFPYTYRWAEALPGRIGLLVAPHLELDLFFLLLA